MLSVVAAAGLERYRLNMVQDGHTVEQHIVDKTVTAADITIFWQVPQFLLIGGSEVFASITGARPAPGRAPCAQPCAHRAPPQASSSPTTRARSPCAPS